MCWLQDFIFDVQYFMMCFGGLVVVNDFLFKVGCGEIIVFIGFNGVGKIMVFNCIIGFYKLIEGMIVFCKLDGLYFLLEWLLGYDINWKGKVVCIFQNICLFFGMILFENLLVVQYNLLMIVFGFIFMGVFGIGGYCKVEKEVIEKVKFWLEKICLIYWVDELAGDFFYGDQCCLEIVCVMCMDLFLFCLDELAVGFNLCEFLELNQFLLLICDEQGILIFLIEYDMLVVMEIFDYVVVLDYGIKILDGLFVEVRNDFKVIVVYFGVVDDEVEKVEVEIGL